MLKFTLSIFSLLFFLCLSGFAQEMMVSGVVTDAESGEALPGVNIFAKDSKEGTVTNNDGVYEIKVSTGDFLTFSFTGYVAQEIQIGQATVINVQLKPDISQLDEVVVTGYTTQSKRSSTGSISTIGAEELRNAAAIDVTQALQGRVSGVTVSGQGGPGQSQVIRIRGFGSLGDNDPLYVIDGVQTKVGLNQINPNDIESIAVLKDPSTAALYGSRGANGVIVITTKKGSKGDASISYNGYAGIQFIPNRLFPDVLSPQQLANVVWEGKRNAPGFNGTFNHDIYLNGNQPVIPAYIIPKAVDMPGGIDPSNYQYVPGSQFRYTKTNAKGTDWFDEIFDPAFFQNHQIDVGGGNEKNRYNVSFNYTDDNGVVVYTDFKRYSVRVNTDFKIREWLKIGENVTSSFSTSHSFGSQTRQGPVINAYLMPEIFPVYDVGGNLSGPNGLTGSYSVDNPLFSLRNGKDNLNQSIRVFGSVYADLEPISNLVFRTQIGVDYMNNHYNYFLPISAETTLASATGRMGEGSSFNSEWRWLNKLAYKRDFDKHHINVFAAVEASENIARFIQGETSGFLYNNIDYRYLSAGSDMVSILGTGTQSTLYSVFGSAEYNYSDKYYLSGVLRRDGSSKFGRNERFGMFPSVGLGWVISEERFLNENSWISHLKLRASWGRIGNEAINPSQTITRFGSDPYYANYDFGGTNTGTSAGMAAVALGNANLKWETNETLDFGVDFNAFDSHVQLSFDWYKRDTKDLLYAPAASSTTNGGLLPTVQNVLSFVNKGVDIELTYFSAQMGDFSFDVGMNFSAYRNEVTKLAPDLEFINGASVLNSSIARHVVGKPLGQFYGFVQDGIYQDAEEVSNSSIIVEANPDFPENLVGHFKYVNVNGVPVNGRQVINNDDRTFIGNPHPDFTYGINVNLRYKQFDMNLLLQGVQGGDIFNWFRSVTDFPNGGTTNHSTRVLNSWRPDNTDASLPIIQEGNQFSDNRISSFFVEDGSYMRLKNLQVGYSFKGITGMKSFRLYIQAQNLLTFTKYSGIDPEVSSGNPSNMGVDFGNNYPIARKVLLGVSLGF